MELATADHSRLKREGRSFNCETCPQKIKTLRRCGEDRDDFTEDDGAIWPMVIEKGGTPFGFCPAKAAWDGEALAVFRLLGLAAETVLVGRGALAVVLGRGAGHARLPPHPAQAPFVADALLAAFDSPGRDLRALLLARAQAALSAWLLRREAAAGDAPDVA
jgi:hypothetical protein